MRLVDAERFEILHFTPEGGLVDAEEVWNESERQSAQALLEAIDRQHESPAWVSRRIEGENQTLCLLGRRVHIKDRECLLEMVAAVEDRQ